MIDPFFRSNKTFRAPDPPTVEQSKHNKKAPNPPTVVDFSKPVFLQSSPIPNRNIKRITPTSVPTRNNNQMHNANTVLLNKMSTPKKEVAHQRPTLSPPPVPPTNGSAATYTSNTGEAPIPPPLPSVLLTTTTPVLSDERSDLMAAIRAAGGSDNAKLKKVSKTVDQKQPTQQHKFGLSTTTVFSSTVKTKTTNDRGDFMSSLTKVLEKRRQDVEAACSANGSTKR
ncbi:hypothetical protein M3Y94_01233600 [Aphelenchoides besseyi]|nr:hypothetical protein M3Y94_01233600 [Aphelenchoides besseyi]